MSLNITFIYKVLVIWHPFQFLYLMCDIIVMMEILYQNPFGSVDTMLGIQDKW